MSNSTLSFHAQARGLTPEDAVILAARLNDWRLARDDERDAERMRYLAGAARGKARTVRLRELAGV